MSENTIAAEEAQIEIRIATWIENRVAEIISNENEHQKLPIHLKDPRFPEVMGSLIGEFEVVAMTIQREFHEVRPDRAFTFDHAVTEHTCAIRSYDQLVAAAGGASTERRLETLECLRMKYIAQQRRFESKHGFIPGGGEKGVELEAVDTVLAELQPVATQ